MLRRRLLALLLAMCVAGGLIVAPGNAAVLLVCRMTGRPMAPILRAAGEPEERPDGAPPQMPCCVVRVRQDAGGAVHVALATRSCCDLKVSALRTRIPVSVSPPFLHLPIGVPASPLAIPKPEVTSDRPYARLIARAAAPRAPPWRQSPLRAPPVLS
jgi:hypothetical protein